MAPTPTQFEHSYPVNDITSDATWTSVADSGTSMAAATPVTGYPITNLFNEDPAFPVKFTETRAALLGDFTVPVAPVMAVVVHPNCTRGYASLYLQANSSNSWTVPAFNQAFPAADYYPNSFPQTLHLDLRLLGSPSYRYWRLFWASANVVPIAVGEFLLIDALHTLARPPKVGSFWEEEEHPLTEHRTAAGIVTVNRRGTWLRTLHGLFEENAANAALIQTWNRSSFGRADPFIILPNLQPAIAEYVRFGGSKLRRTYVAGQYRSQYEVEFEALSAGLKPTPAAV